MIDFLSSCSCSSIAGNKIKAARGHHIILFLSTAIAKSLQALLWHFDCTMPWKRAVFFLYFENKWILTINLPVNVRLDRLQF